MSICDDARGERDVDLAKVVRVSINIQLDNIREVVEETIKKKCKETADLYTTLSDWIDLRMSLSKMDRNVYLNMLSITFFEHFWRAYQWIFFEILSGAYFEALRDLRFVFEGALKTIHYDYYIEHVILERHGTISHLGYKVLLIDLIDRFSNRIHSKRKENRYSEEDYDEFLRKEAEKFVNEEEDKLKSVEGNLDEVKSTTQEILSQKELHISTSKIVQSICKEFRLKKRIRKYLTSIWGELSGYAHFSSSFLKDLLRIKEQFVMLSFNKEQFDLCAKMALRVFDVICGAITVLYHPVCCKTVEEIVNRRRKESGIELIFTNAILEKIQD